MGDYSKRFENESQNVCIKFQASNNELSSNHIFLYIAIVTQCLFAFRMMKRIPMAFGF